jgi:hypothetical protein
MQLMMSLASHTLKSMDGKETV